MFRMAGAAANRAATEAYAQSRPDDRRNEHERLVGAYAAGRLETDLRDAPREIAYVAYRTAVADYVAEQAEEDNPAAFEEHAAAIEPLDAASEDAFISARSDGKSIEDAYVAGATAYMGLLEDEPIDVVAAYEKAMEDPNYHVRRVASAVRELLGG